MNDVHDDLVHTILHGLNENQLKAVTSPADSRLQIIAGPGTGKTKVLISRVAYLLVKDQIPANRIIVTTFTKKAALEMTERLEKLLKPSSIDISKILIGTFHSICFKILRIYGSFIGVNNFNIADERDSTQLMKETLAALTPSEAALDGLIAFKNGRNGFDHKKLKSLISKLKSNNILADGYTKNKFLSLIYTKYQQRLVDLKLLDFDDCLMYCHALIKNHSVLKFIRHVLVDEFQDTNEVQLQLMYEFAKGTLSNNVTIVGDPDQSIYGFRNAQSENFDKMIDHYQFILKLPVTQVQLDTNYRSTSDILKFSENLMTQQKIRTSKNLKSTISSSFIPVHDILSSPIHEARWIVWEIEHLMALPNSPFQFSDIAIIVRASNQTRVLENEFVKRKIPYIMVRGKAFWERKEVTAILDYLRIISSDFDRIAYLRTINFPKRGIGSASLNLIESVFEKDSTQGVLQLQSLSNIINDKNVKINGKTKLKLYLKFIEESKAIMKELENAEESKIEQTLTRLFEFVYTESGLKNEYRELEDEKLNILEVKKQLTEFRPVADDLTFAEELKQDPEIRNFLNQFLQSIGLYETQSLQSTGNDKKGKVSLTTIHGSKGLEWPVVFVPGLTDGVLPASFAMREDDENSVNEERRCFYVACTRPKTLLYLSSYTEEESKWGRPPMTEVSRFLKNALNLTKNQTAFKDEQLLGMLYSTLNVPLIIDKEKFKIEIFYKSYESRRKVFLDYGSLDVKGQDYATEKVGLGGFVSAKNVGSLGLKRSKPNYQNVKRPQTSQTYHISNPSTASLKQPIQQFKAPTISRTSKAPVYIHGEVTKKAPQKAPPYIPTRKKK